MKIINYNDKVRKNLSRLINEAMKKDKDYKYVKLFYSLFKKIKNNSGVYDYILGLIFESVYLVTNFTLMMYPDDEDLLNSIYYLKSFSSIEELKESLTIYDFINYLQDVDYFYTSDSYYKKSVVESSLKDKDFLMNFFPCFLVDVLSYLNRYDASEVLEEYHERLKTNDENAFENAVIMTMEDLINLEKKDFDAYKFVVLEMIETYYMYKKSLLSLEESDEMDIILISLIEEDLISLVYFSVNNIAVLESLISGYLKYNLLSEKELKDIKKYYDNENNKNKLLKVIKKSNNLKNTKS